MVGGAALHTARAAGWSDAGRGEQMYSCIPKPLQDAYRFRGHMRRGKEHVPMCFAHPRNEQARMRDIHGTTVLLHLCPVPCKVQFACGVWCDASCCLNVTVLVVLDK